MKQEIIGRSGKIPLVSEDRKRSVEIWTKWCHLSQDILVLGALAQKDSLSTAKRQDFMHWLIGAKEVRKTLDDIIIETRTFIKEKIDGRYTK